MMTGRSWLLSTVIIAAALAARCGDVNAALRQVSEARRLSADLLVEFIKAADAANRAVMADTDALSSTFAREANDAKQAVQRDVEAVGPILQGLKYADETRLLEEFRTKFAEYDRLDREILELAVENTNLKAQRLSFGPAQAAADAFRDSLDAAARSAAATNKWRVQALVATAVGAVREIQALQAPHIADPEDAAMTSLEQRMAAAEAVARNALKILQTISGAASRPKLGAAETALDRFMSLHAQIVALSRQNTNVRSLALSLDQKQKLIAPCEERLRALRDAIAKHGYPVGRTGPRPGL